MARPSKVTPLFLPTMATGVYVCACVCVCAFRAFIDATIYLGIHRHIFLHACTHIHTCVLPTDGEGMGCGAHGLMLK